MQRLTVTTSVLWVFLLFAAGPSVAATINVNYSLNNGEPVDIKFNGSDMSTYGLEFSPVNLDFDMDGSYDLATIAYCVELTQGVGSGDTYPVDLLTATGNYLAAAWIMHNYAGSGDSTQNAAVQVAIWETVYDGVGGALDTGRFQLTGGDAQIYTLAQGYITGLTSAGLTGLDRYMIAHSATKQDLLVAVPIPAAVWLFGSGLLGLIGFRNRSGRC
jgi:Thioester domain